MVGDYTGDGSDLVEVDDPFASSAPDTAPEEPSAWSQLTAPIREAAKFIGERAKVRGADIGKTFTDMELGKF